MTSGGPGPHVQVSICVAVYRAHPEPNLTTLLRDLPEATQGLDHEVVVALNGIDAAAAGSPPSCVQLVRHARNRGVSVGWNSALERARGDVVVVVNDDVRLGPGSIAMLHAALQDPAAGVVGPVGTRWDIPRAQHLSYVDTAGQAPGTTTACEVLSGFLLAARRSTWDAVGGFDETYSPCGFEEVDVCTAVRERLGLRCLVVAGVAFEHEFGISARRSWRRIRWDGRSESLGSIARRNRRYFLDKWSQVSVPAEPAP